MKNLSKLNKLVFVFFIICSSKISSAQNGCEFDSIYGFETKNFNTEVGYKIVENDDKKVFVASIDGHSRGLTPSNMSLKLNLIDECGTLIWKNKIDSSLGVNNLPNNAKIIDLIKRPNGNFLYIANYYGKVKKPALPGIQFFSINTNGEVIWKSRLVDSTNNYDFTSATEINANLYLLAGQKNGKAFYLICDTLVNVISENTFVIDSTKSSSIQKVYLMDNKTLTLLGIEDTIVFVKNMDSLGNILSNLKIYTNKIYSNKTIDFNFKKTQFVLNGLKGSSSLYYATYELNGNLIKDSVFSTFFRVKQLSLNLFLMISTYSWIKTDSNFNILSVDNYLEVKDGPGIYYRKAILDFSAPNTIVYGVGSYMISGGSGNTLNSLFLKKINSTNHVFSITINGSSNINIKNGSILYTTNILPTTANNKTILWSISDTNLATITQTGLVTAKVNGTVTVTAQTTDGSNLTATKTITITNQNVGINEANLNGQITIYPNPTSSKLTIITNNLTIQQLQLQDITGKVIVQFANQNELDLQNIANGMYLLYVQTSNGKLIKQVVVNK